EQLPLTSTASGKFPVMNLCLGRLLICHRSKNAEKARGTEEACPQSADFHRSAGAKFQSPSASLDRAASAAPGFLDAFACSSISRKRSSWGTRHLMARSISYPQILRQQKSPIGQRS